MESVTPSIKVQFRPLFPTLIAEIEHPDPGPLNSRLLAFIRKIRDELPPEERATTINRGWRSKSNLLDHDVPEISSLRAFFDESIATYVNYWAKQFGSSQRALMHRYKGWAVVIEEHGYQHQHVHSRTDLVGVYCVQRPEAEIVGSDPGGALTLIDPRTGRLSTRTNWETDLVHLQPVPGRLFLIPSFVAHRVEAVTAPGERITINFDAIVVERS